MDILNVGVVDVWRFLIKMCIRDLNAGALEEKIEFGYFVHGST